MTQKENWNKDCILYQTGEIKGCSDIDCPDDYMRCIFYAGVFEISESKGLEKEVVEET